MSFVKGKHPFRVVRDKKNDLNQFDDTVFGLLHNLPLLTCFIHNNKRRVCRLPRVQAPDCGEGAKERAKTDGGRVEKESASWRQRGKVSMSEADHQ